MRLLAVVAALSSACVHKVERNLADPSRPAALDTESEFLKVHMRDGGLYVLTSWDVDEAKTMGERAGDAVRLQPANP